MRPSRILLFLFALLTVAAVAPQDDEIVKEFKKYFRKYKDSATRVEAVLALEGTESLEVVDVLVPILGDADPEVARSAIRVLSGFKTRPLVDELLLVLAKAKDVHVRVGILQAIESGRYSGTKEILAPLLQDGEWEVRRRTLQALLATEGAAVAEAVEPLCADGEVAVRCAALDGLASVRSGLVVQSAIGNLTEGSWQVRASAIHALAIVRHRDSIGPLIGRLEVEEGRLVADIGQALDEITGRGFGQRLDLWKSFWERYGDVFQIPTDEELAVLREKQRERKEAYDGKGAGRVNYHGIDTPSRSILFVIDTSGSMEQEVTDRERYEGGGYSSFQRIDIVKTELSRTIQNLESYVKFNVLSFATDVKQWKKGLVGANPLNKSSAQTFIQRLEAIGGSSKEDLASAGLFASANLEAGKTNTFAALMAALQVEENKKRDDYEVEIDTIFFLSDGRPSTGKFIDTDDILGEVRRVNELRRIVIHTLAIGEFEKDFMMRLAQENGGVFVDLGK